MIVNNPDLSEPEGILKDFLECLMSFECQVLYAGKARVSTEEYSWVHVVGANSELSIAVSQSDLADVTLEIARQLCLSSCDEFKVTEPDELIGDAELDRFIVSSNDLSFVSSVLLTTKCLVPRTNKYRTSAAFPLFLKRYFILGSFIVPTFDLSEQVTEIDYENVGCKFSHGDSQMGLRIFDCIRNIESSKIVMKVPKEETMCSDYGIELQVGEFKLQEQDFLGLRPGSVIETELENNLDCVIAVKGVPLAYASLSFEDSKLVIKVNAFDEKSIANPETIEPIERTLNEFNLVEAL